ncbi:MAG: hypothetical protein LUH14_10420 [Clostridiaceae bacterium]|nr:hypothetical protein [Clostridiaceae bacterium]
MAEYGVTDKGFVIKRLDVILEELHSELSEQFGFNTRLDSQSFLNVLITTCGGKFAELWEVLQDSYYAKYPSTAEGANLDNAVQYGGIRRSPNKYSYYKLHCTGDDGTVVREGAVVATNTAPQKKLAAVSEFEITRDNFNCASVRVAAAAEGEIYSVSINGVQYSYTSSSDDELSIIKGLYSVVAPDGYTVSVNESDITLDISDETTARSGILVLSDNLTTSSVTVLADFATVDYGKLIFPNGTITVMVTNISGFNEVNNLISPTYGRIQETDVELRHSYIAKSAIRSTRMIDSICSQLINNVDNVESATGYENDTDDTDEEGRPPHSVEIIVDGGDEAEIASIILEKKAAGIQTYGDITVSVATEYGDSVPISFNRPEYIYVWMKVTLDADSSYLPTNFANLTIDSIVEDAAQLQAGDNLLSQTFNEGIYTTVGGVTYVDIKCASTTSKDYIPTDDEYTKVNVTVTSRQKIVVSDTRIEVVYSGNS